jgi:antitoxin component of MazEF toxin-antitoxin module
MHQVVHSKIVKMGNDFGIRIPRRLLDQAGLSDEVEILVENRSLVIRAVGKPASGEELLDKTIFSPWEDDDWG